jgi:DNA-directed RNA polymerase subunit beta'
MPTRETKTVRPDEISRVHLCLASPDQIRDWSWGQVREPETLNYRTGRPKVGGLFCERIFGPEKDWQCACGKLRGLRFKGFTCERCQVQVNSRRARRQRLGHIELPVPVVHLWFFKLRPSYLGQLFDLKVADLEDVIYYHRYLVLDPGSSELQRYQFLSPDELIQARQRYGEDFSVSMGGEAILTLLQELDLEALSTSLREELAQLLDSERPSQERVRKRMQRLRIVEGLLHSNNNPEWMVLRCLPVIPPDLRPIVLLSSGGYATSDLNDLYRRVLQRSLRLDKLLAMEAPEVILRNEKRLLQQAVDALFDNERLKRPALGTSSRALKSLSGSIKGKEGRFRENLLGKRVDYSGRSVIVVGPELKLHQCGLPKKMALELYQPFIIRELLAQDLAVTVHGARKVVGRGEEIIWDLLAQVMQGHPVLLNRAPTLHRMGIQAFEPLLVEGNAIRLHPLVCKAFNADFDGDQMAVHLPLSVQAREEAWNLLLAPHNVFNPANGQPIVTPSQDMVLGCYYLTAPPAPEAGSGRAFHAPSEVLTALDLGKLRLHDPVQLRLPVDKVVMAEECEGALRELPRKSGQLIATTAGRVLFNDHLSPELPFYNVAMSARNLSHLIADAQHLLGRDRTVQLLEQIKTMGFRMATRSGLSIASSDLCQPANKETILDRTWQGVKRINALFQEGNLSAERRSDQLIDLWSGASKEIAQELQEELARDRKVGEPVLNPLHLMVRSGARGNREQVRQLAGLRGLMTRPSGEVVETPITSSFREGLSVLEYFISTHGGRKGLADTALKTSDSGYLTRKLADVAQHVVIRCKDCGTRQGLVKRPWDRAQTLPRSLGATVLGRISCEDVVSPLGERIIAAGDWIDREQAQLLDEAGILEIRVRSPLTCEAADGLCQACYGTDLATGRPVAEGVAVGILAAQSIGEPATQLTLRTFHTGGAASTPDITVGLPRVHELFEALCTDRHALLAELTGIVRLGTEAEQVRGKQSVFIAQLDAEDRPTSREHRHLIPQGKTILVQDGERVTEGQRLTEGAPTLQDLLRLHGRDVARDYALEELQAVYRQQGVELDDRHLEVILQQMFRRVKVIRAGDTDLLPGSVIDRKELEEANAQLKARGGRSWRQPRLASAQPLVLGVGRAALHAAGFLSAASFQETTRILAEAALAGKIDDLRGLKENVLLGRLIPAGTGYTCS